ncbi:MAG: DUF7873 family protein [Planctomycetota bacterium]|jgi:hypothetical protein
MAESTLHQIIALASGKKTRAERVLTKAHHGWNADALSGITRSYKPIDEDGQRLPSEGKHVHVRVEEKVRDVISALTDYYDVVCMQELGNTRAHADVTIGEERLLTCVPVTVLLFLERQLQNLHTFAKEMPTLAADREWHWDANRGCYATAPRGTVKTAKLPKVIVKYEATKEHPAQTELVTIDTPVGEWTTVDFSGAIPVDDKREIIVRIERLLDAVKQSREQANSEKVENAALGGVVLDYVFGDFLNRRAQSKS